MILREVIQKNKEYQKGKVPNLLGPPQIILAILTHSLLPKIRKSEHFFGEFQKPNLAISNHNQSG